MTKVRLGVTDDKSDFHTFYEFENEQNALTLVRMFEIYYSDGEWSIVNIKCKNRVVSQYA